MAVRLGKYAQLRPDPESSLTQVISGEFKRDLMDENVDLLGNSTRKDKMKGGAEKDKKKKKSKKRSKKSRKRNDSSDSNSSSGDDRSERSRSGEGRSKAKRRRRSRSRDRSKDRKRDTKRAPKPRTPSPVSSYVSPSSLENDSDLESNGLELKYDLEPLIHHLHLDRELFNKQIFKIIKGRRRKHLLPQILRPMPDKELKLACLTELSQWSNKRIRVLMQTGDLMPADAKGALIDTKKLFAEMQKRDEEESMREKKRQEAIDQGIDPEEFLKNELAKANAEAEAAKASKSVASQSSVESSNDPEKSEIPKAEKKNSKDSDESEEEDIEQMRENLEKWRKQKYDDEMAKLRAKHKIEMENVQKEVEEEIIKLNKKREEKQKEKERLEELNKKMSAIKSEMEKKQAEKQGMVLVEKTTLKKDKKIKKKEDEVGPDGAEGENKELGPLEKGEESSGESSLEMDDMEASASNRSLTDEEHKNETEKERKKRKKKERKEKRKNRKKDATEAANHVGPKANLCPDVPYGLGIFKKSHLFGDVLVLVP